MLIYFRLEYNMYVHVQLWKSREGNNFSLKSRSKNMNLIGIQKGSPTDFNAQKYNIFHLDKNLLVK